MTPKSTFISTPVAICTTTVAIFPMVPRSLSRKDAAAECFFNNLLLSADKSNKLIFQLWKKSLLDNFNFSTVFCNNNNNKKHLQYTSSTGLQFIQCLEFCVKNKLVLFLSSFLSVKEEKAARLAFIPHSSTLEALSVSGETVTSAILGATYLIDQIDLRCGWHQVRMSHTHKNASNKKRLHLRRRLSAPHLRLAYKD